MPALRTALNSAGVDALLVGPSTDLVYLTGINAHLSERLNLLIIAVSGQTRHSWCRDSRLRMWPTRQIWYDLHVWEETESPSELAGSLTGRHKRIAIGDHLHAVFVLRIAGGGTGRELDPGWTGAQDLALVSKDAAEIAAQREVAERTDKAWAAFLEAGPISGLTETRGDRASECD